MKKKWLLSPDRRLTEEEKNLVWKKPATHIESDAERRICTAVRQNWDSDEMKITNILLEGDAGSGKTQLVKALSADFGLPYTKVTCFADMDKSDVLGTILPVLSQSGSNGKAVKYEYYPSEIIRAYENGWLLEIQEPTVIRDAAVLMALNSALEPDGSINLPTRIAHRHPDFITVITTNRGYNGCRPLNEALRDRVQHAEKMDLPAADVMVKRAAAKTGCKDKLLLQTLAQAIILLDKTAKANAIKGVAGMRSYFFWVDAAIGHEEIIDALYHKVIYKITTDPDEVSILEQALEDHGMMAKLTELARRHTEQSGEVIELHTEEMGKANFTEAPPVETPAVALHSSNQSRSDSPSESSLKTESDSTDDGDSPIYHELSEDAKKEVEARKQLFRKQLNTQSREFVKGSPHEKINLILHRPEPTPAQQAEYRRISAELMPVIRELVRQTKPLLTHEVATEFSNNKVYGSRFHAENLASPDFRYFSKKSPPEDEPSLAVVLRIDQSASMNAFGRLDAAKQAAVAVCEFCESCNIPLLVYGDTADRSPREKMSLYSYIDWDEPTLNDKRALMAIRSFSNNRDGMALRILAEKLAKAPQKTKLLISLSDGQPKALPDYTGEPAINDMKQVITAYSRKGILFLAAAIGQDKETICDIYGQERFIDITDLRQLPTRLVRLIANYL